MTQNLKRGKVAQLAQQGGTIGGNRPNMTQKVLDVLSAEPAGLSASAIAIRTGIPRRTVYNSLIRLTKQHKVVNNRPIWEVAQIQCPSENCATLFASGENKKTGQSDRINLHRVAFKISLIQKPLWWNQRHNKLTRLKEYNVGQVSFGNSPYTKLMDDLCTMHLFRHTIVFYLKKQYAGKDVWDCYLQAQEDFLAAYASLERATGFRFFKEGVPQASIVSSHYVLLRDAFAKRCTKDGKLFRVYDEKDRLRVLIDMSHPKGIEGVSTEYSQDDIDYYQRFVRDLIVNRPLMPSEITSAMTATAQATQNVANIQEIFNANMASHIAAIKQLGTAVEMLTELIKEQKGGKKDG